jgi:hypothetical protein
MLRTSILFMICLLCPALAGADPDQIPPDPITNVTVATGKTTLVVTWQNTGDDGTTGDAEEFMVRRSSTTITSRHSGTLMASGPAGSSGSFSCAGTSGLPCNTPFYVAVFLKDDHNNWSDLGTVVLQSTQSCNSIQEIFCFNLLRGSRDAGRLDRTVVTEQSRPSA